MHGGGRNRSGQPSWNGLERDFRAETEAGPRRIMVLRYPTRVSQHDQPSLSARPPPRMPASAISTGNKESGREFLCKPIENGHDSRSVQRSFVIPLALNIERHEGKRD